MIKEIMKYIDKAKTIYLVTHIRPDGDAIGSTFAMCLALKELGKDAKVLMPEYSKKYNFLEDMKDTVSEIVDDSYDLLVCMDCSEKKRLSISAETFARAKNVVVFDHHKMSSVPADASYIDDESPATCELVYKFMKANDIYIDSKIAGYIYMGIMTDTGSFNYARTTSDSYKIAAEMIDLGADFVTICKLINDTETEAKTRLISYVIDNMEVHYGGKLRISIVSHDTLTKLGVDDEDSEGMTNYLRMIEGTELAVYIRQSKEGNYKASLRSNGDIDCSKIAFGFGGGGHIRAAGYDVKDLTNDKEKLIQIMGEVFTSENNRNTEY